MGLSANSTKLYLCICVFMYLYLCIWSPKTLTRPIWPKKIPVCFLQLFCLGALNGIKSVKSVFPLILLILNFLTKQLCGGDATPPCVKVLLYSAWEVTVGVNDHQAMCSDSTFSPFLAPQLHGVSWEMMMFLWNAILWN